MDFTGKDSPTPAVRRLYFNRAQLEAMVVAARNEYIVGGRGLGKSEGFDARVLLRNAFAMPGSAGALLSPSYTKLKTLTFPAIAAALARWGYQQGRHYTVGIRPPRAALQEPDHRALRVAQCDLLLQREHRAPGEL